METISTCANCSCRFLEELVKRLSEELATRLAAEGPTATQAALQAASSAAAAGPVGANVPLPPWMKDNRCVGRPKHNASCRAAHPLCKDTRGSLAPLM